MEIGQKIDHVLKIKGWSAARLAKLVGVSAATISRIIRGGDTASALAVKIAHSLGESVDWLCDETRGLDSRNERSGENASALSDLELTQLIEARLRRLVSAQREALKFLNGLPGHSEKRYLSYDDRDKLTQAMARRGFAASTYANILHWLDQLGQAIRDTDLEMKRVVGIGGTWPDAGDASFTRVMVGKIRELFDKEGAPYPWHETPVEAPPSPSSPSKKTIRKKPPYKKRR